jgi:hypothetical protein
MSDDDQEPEPAGEGPEPPPSGEGPEPAPSGEGAGPPPSGEEPEPAPADSSNDSSSGSGRRRKSSSSSDSSDSSSSSSDSSTNDSAGESCVNLSEDDVQSALTSAFQERNVPVDDDGVKVTKAGDLFHLMVRLTADAAPLPQVPDDTSNLEPGSVQGAQLMVLGAVQAIDGGTRVTMRVVKVETSEVLQTGSGDAMGTANKDAVQAAAEDALAALDMLHTQ